MEAVILAGGLGTRLRSVVSDVPKPMAPMDKYGKPFLSLLLDNLETQGVHHIIISIGYKGEAICDYFGRFYKGIPITYVIEESPLLTGGAIKKALHECEDNVVFIFNGDTFFEVDLRSMFVFHKEHKADLTIAVKKIESSDRYGGVVFTNDGLILSFGDKDVKSECINGGIYCMQSDLFDTIESDRFSMESDFIQSRVGCNRFYAFQSAGIFIDIGIPEDYIRAKSVLKRFIITHSI